MTTQLTALGEKLGLTAVLVWLALGGLLTAKVFLAQSLAEWFGDRNP